MDEIQALKDRIADLEAVPALRWDANMRAIKRWQEAHPGNDLIWPNHADLCVWCIQRSLKYQIKALVKLVEGIR